jgi:hypothetical protein
MLLRIPLPGHLRRLRIAGRYVVVVMAAVVLAGLSAGCRGGGKPTLSHLRGVEELKTRFNRDAGTPRIVLLLSPT